MAAERRKRGPYKRYLRDPTFPIPKQTLCNWRQKRLVAVDESHTTNEDSDHEHEPLSPNYYSMESTAHSTESVDSEEEPCAVPFTSPTPATPPSSPLVEGVASRRNSVSPAATRPSSPLTIVESACSSSAEPHLSRIQHAVQRICFTLEHRSARQLEGFLFSHWL